MDRVRIANKNMQLDPNRLRTRSAKELVSFSYDNFANKFSSVKNDYDIYLLENQDPILRECAELVKDSIGLDWILNNREFLIDCYDRGILQNFKNDGMFFIDYIENEDLVKKTSNQILKGDFEELRKSGYNITYESFVQIVGSYKAGTLETLRNEGKLNKLFSYETFLKYGLPQSFNDRITKGDDIQKEELFEKINKSNTTQLTKQVFDEEYMLYKNMYNNHKYAFDLFTYCDLDVSFRSVVGILEKIKINDLNILKEKGYNLSLSDLITVASKYSPEEYVNILDSNNAEKLFSYNPSKDNDREKTIVWDKILAQNPNISEEELLENYELYKRIAYNNKDIYSIPEMSNYSIKEIYPAFAKIQEAEWKMNTITNKTLRFNPQSIIDLIEFSKKTKILDSNNEEEKSKIIGLIIQNGAWKNDPRLIEYVTKKNKVYRIKNVEDILDYNRYCIDQILTDNNITLEQAKINLVNSLINIDCPKTEYKKELEENIIDELYYYRKYQKQGKLSEDKEDFSNIIDQIIGIMDSTNIQEFKDRLYNNYQEIGNYNFDSILERTRTGFKRFI